MLTKHYFFMEKMLLIPKWLDVLVFNALCYFDRILYTNLFSELKSCFFEILIF